MPTATIVIATKFKEPLVLKKTLNSIYLQEAFLQPNTRYDVIVVDDNDEDIGIREAVADFDGPHLRVEYLKNTDKCPCNNPGYARNFGYKQAKGDILICASDDIIIPYSDSLDEMLDQFVFSDNQLLVAHTINAQCEFGEDGLDLEKWTEINTIVSPQFFPYMFFGMVWKEHMFKVGGNDRRFIHSGFEDRLVVECLQNHCKLQTFFSDELVIHQHHNKAYHSTCQECDNGNYSGKLYWELHGKMSRGEIPWTSDTGPWK
jgi:glycosyltransferase involved in cell wall biosynthesis